MEIVFTLLRTSTPDSNVPIMTKVVKVTIPTAEDSYSKELDEDIDTNDLPMSSILKVKFPISSTIGVFAQSQLPRLSEGVQKKIEIEEHKGEQKYVGAGKCPGKR